MIVKKLINTIFLFLAFVTVKASPSDSLSKANDFYASSEISKAIQVYENIVDDGFESSSLYFNLGNAYYKNGDINKAILFYERAKLLAPNDEDIEFNLDLMNQFVVDKIETLPRPFFVKWGQSIANLLGVDGWAKISLISFILALAFILAFVFSINSRIKKTSFTIAIIFILVTLFSFSYAYKQKKKIETRNHAIIFSPTVTVKSSPNESGTNIFVVHEGLKVEITDELNDWIEIKLGDGNSGWVEKNVLEKI